MAKKTNQLFVERVQRVLQDKTKTGLEIYYELRNRNWIPASKDPLGYVRFTLSSRSDLFLRDRGRGYYRLSMSNPFYHGMTRQGTCIVCERPLSVESTMMCRNCDKAYDKFNSKDSTTIGLMAWVATRARYFLRRKKAK